MSHIEYFKFYKNEHMFLITSISQNNLHTQDKFSQSNPSFDYYN